VTTILLARHGETDWNRALRWQGHADRPLTDLGHAQARTLAEQLDAFRIDAIYSSDLERARVTAEAVAARRRLEVVVRCDLREVDCGSWSGCYHSDLEPSEIERWKAGAKAWAGGESYEQMAERMVGAIRSVASGHTDQHVLVVSHGAAIRAVHAAATGLSFHEYRRLHPTVENAGLSAVLIENGKISELTLHQGAG
jgi:broad specificity phosphatase PhoE